MLCGGKFGDEDCFCSKSSAYQISKKHLFAVFTSSRGALLTEWYHSIQDDPNQSQLSAHHGDSATFSWPCFLTSSRVCIFWVWGVCLLSLCGGAAAVTDAVVGMYSERPSLGIVVMLLLTGGKNTVFNRKALFSWTIYSNCCRKYIKDAKDYCCCRNRNDEKRSL